MYLLMSLVTMIPPAALTENFLKCSRSWVRKLTASSVKKVVRFGEGERAVRARLWNLLMNVKIAMHVGVCSCSNQAPPPLSASSLGLKSDFCWRARSLVTQTRTTSIERCMIELTFSSMPSMAAVEVFSMSRRIVTLAVASGMRTVRMQVFIRYIVLMAGRRLRR